MDISLRKCSFSFCCFYAENKDFTAILVTRCKITKGYNLSKTHEATVDQSDEERHWTLGISRSFRTNLCNETVPQNSGSSPSVKPPTPKKLFSMGLRKYRYFLLLPAWLSAALTAENWQLWGNICFSALRRNPSIAQTCP